MPRNQDRANRLIHFPGWRPLVPPLPRPRANFTRDKNSNIVSGSSLNVLPLLNFTCLDGNITAGSRRRSYCDVVPPDPKLFFFFLSPLKKSFFKAQLSRRHKGHWQTTKKLPTYHNCLAVSPETFFFLLVVARALGLSHIVTWTSTAAHPHFTQTLQLYGRVSTTTVLYFNGSSSQPKRMAVKLCVKIESTELVQNWV